MQRCRLSLVLPALLIAFGLASVHGATPNIPPFFSCSATFDQPPELRKPVTLRATLEGLIGTAHDIRVTADLPDGWPPLAPQRLPELRVGNRHEFTWTVIPPTTAENGSILVRLTLRTPKEELTKACQEQFPGEAAAMAEGIRAWPDETSTTADVAFTLTEDEGFYPLTGDAWMQYDSRLQPKGAKRGVVYSRDPLLSVSQAQTDVEMYEQLQTLLKSDPGLGEKLASSGVDVRKKKLDQLYGLYVLGTEHYEKGAFDAALGLLQRLRDELPNQPASPIVDLGIAAGNLIALSHWAKGDQRSARKAFQDTFYGNRKHPLQRYILRNLGLLMLDTGDQTTAREMLRLAVQAKPTYSLVAREFEELRAP